MRIGEAGAARRFTEENPMTGKDKQVALVTGGSTGIGAAVALQLAQAGATVVISGRHESTLRTSAARHPGIAHVVADVANPADAARSVDEVRARYGRLDVLVNNAGIAEIAPLSDATSAHVRRTLATNVEGLIETTRAALPLLRQSEEPS
jgi:NAD(P)-dependent dehydrogenase (short-subunit alcohol dehydrogenase family)